MLRLNARTTLETLERCRKDELVAAILEARPNLVPADVRRLSKTDLVTCCMAAVNEIKTREAEEAEQAERLRQDVLAREREAGLKVRCLTALLQSVDHELATIAEAVTEFQTEIAKGGWAIPSALTWKAENVLQMIARAGEFEPLKAHLTKQIEEQSETADEVEVEFQRRADELLRTCLDNGYRHCSTNAMDNLNNMAGFAAKQYAARWFKNLLKTWNDAKSKNDPMPLGFVRVW